MPAAGPAIALSKAALRSCRVARKGVRRACREARAAAVNAAAVNAAAAALVGRRAGTASGFSRRAGARRGRLAGVGRRAGRGAAGARRRGLVARSALLPPAVLETLRLAGRLVRDGDRLGREGDLRERVLVGREGLRETLLFFVTLHLY